MKNFIRHLCEKYTALTDDDITVIIEQAEKLPLLSKNSVADMFIDCPCCEESEAVVIAEALKPDTPYQLSTLGCIVREKDEPAVFRTFRTGLVTSGVEATIFSTAPEGRQIQHVEPIKNEDKTIGVLISEIPSTKKKLSIEKRERSPLRALNNNIWVLDKMDDAVIAVSDDNVVLYRNAAAVKLFQTIGFTEDILGKQYNKIALETLTSDKTDWESEYSVTFSSRIYRIRHHYNNYEKLLIVVIRDITEIEIRRTEASLKTTMLQEVQHRTKNSLQMIHSLLQMQRRRADSQETKDALSDAMKRIQSITAMYDRMQDNDSDNVWLQTVIAGIKRNYDDSSSDKNITIRVVGDDYPVPADMVISLAMVISELIMNSCKYAFKGRDSGEITVFTSTGNMGYASVIIQDNGCGYDVEKTSESLGLKIVRTLVKSKLKGRFEISSDQNGTRAMFDIRIK
jgi:two-component sensor histidine kinase